MAAMWQLRGDDKMFGVTSIPATGLVKGFARSYQSANDWSAMARMSRKSSSGNFAVINKALT